MKPLLEAIGRLNRSDTFEKLQPSASSHSDFWRLWAAMDCLPASTERTAALTRGQKCKPTSRLRWRCRRLLETLLRQIFWALIGTRKLVVAFGRMSGCVGSICRRLCSSQHSWWMDLSAANRGKRNGSIESPNLRIYWTPLVLQLCHIFHQLNFQLFILNFPPHSHFLKVDFALNCDEFHFAAELWLIVHT